MNGFPILSKAIRPFSVRDGISFTTLSVFRSVVIISQATSASSPAMPSRSSARPTPTPTANSSGILSSSAPPAFTRYMPITGSTPLTSPPCIVAGHSR